MIDIEEVDDPVSTAGDRADPERPGVVDLRGREGTGAEPNRWGVDYRPFMCIRSS
ncbi:hypothetical protein [Mesorhizobium sp. M1348]|uniref:hypothetical protein n=1 Tax=unclassified Mesorhizobium TaxID=325217 RepID=UPI00333BF0A8